MTMVKAGLNRRPRGFPTIIARYGAAYVRGASCHTIPQVSAIVLPGGEVLLAFNNASVSALRTPLSLALSLDDGSSWLGAGTVERSAVGDFAYPAMHVVSGNASEVLVAYQVQYPPGVEPDVGTATTAPSVRSLVEVPDGSVHDRALLEMQLRAWGKTCVGIKVAIIGEPA